jgi:hypothetical protein
VAASTWAPKTPAQLAAIFATAFNSQPGVIPINTDEASTAGALDDALALVAAFIQNELDYTNSILRLQTIPPNPDGSVNPDAISFGAPFNVVPLGGEAAQGGCTFSTPSPVAQTVIVPIGAVVADEQGDQFIVVTDTDNGAFDPSAGGYPITVGNDSVTGTVQALVPGISGNVPAGAITQAISGVPSSISTISNADPFTNGAASESNQSFKNRFPIVVSGGGGGTINAEIGAALDVQTGVIYSYGDRVNADGSNHNSYFTLVVNLANTGTAPSSGFLDAVQAAVEAVRSGGVSYQVIAPTIVPVTVSATIVPLPGFNGSDVLTAVNAQWAAFANGTGLASDTTPTMISLARTYAALLLTQINGAFCVADVITLKLDSAAADVTATFANQLVAGTPTFTVT